MNTKFMISFLFYHQWFAPVADFPQKSHSEIKPHFESRQHSIPASHYILIACPSTFRGSFCNVRNPNAYTVTLDRKLVSKLHMASGWDQLWTRATQLRNCRSSGVEQISEKFYSQDCKKKLSSLACLTPHMSKTQENYNSLASLP